MFSTCFSTRIPSGIPTPAATSLRLPCIPQQWGPSTPLWPPSTIATCSRTFHANITSFQEPTTLGNGAPAASPSPLPSSATTAAASLPSLPAPGHIELVIGPMFAGKSSELLHRVTAYEALGLTVAIVKSNKDDRYSKDHVVTHNGESKACHAVPSLEAFRRDFAAMYAAADVIAVDEAQFFPDLIEFCTAAADEDAKRLVLAGLDGDFMRRKFGQVLDLVPLADKVTKLTAVCRFCQTDAETENGGGISGEVGQSEKAFPAVFSLRIAVESEQQEVVGGADKYAPVCRKHYVEFYRPPTRSGSNGSAKS